MVILHKRTFPFFFVASQMNYFRFWPMLDHKRPKQVGGFNNDIEFVLFPNFGQLAKFNLLFSKRVYLERRKLSLFCQFIGWFCWNFPKTYLTRKIGDLLQIEHFVSEGGKELVHRFCPAFRHWNNDILRISAIWHHFNTKFVIDWHFLKFATIFQLCAQLRNICKHIFNFTIS